MLPSTGYFKAINCPFYESGTCERPYCHFKHSKREDVGITAESTETVASRSTGQTQESQGPVVRSDSDVLHLVTEAVKKVLADRDANTDNLSCQNVVSRVVEGLKPTLTSGSPAMLDRAASVNADERTDVTPPVTKAVPCVYNPTPIAELKKRHIPIISYMPTRESRVAVKSKCSPDGIKPWLGSSCESAEARTAAVKYKPTTIVNSEVLDAGQSYVPTCRSDSVSSNSYEDGGSNDYLFKLKEIYYPKCKKRREEYVPKKVKAPLKTVENPNEPTISRFDSEFDIVDTTLTNNKLESNLRSSEEPKFSDDDNDVNDVNDVDVDVDEDEDDDDDDDANCDDIDINDENRENGTDIPEHDTNACKISDEFGAENISIHDVINGVHDRNERSIQVNVKDELREKSCDVKTLGRDNVSRPKETLKISTREKEARTKDDTPKIVNKRSKEYKSKEKSRDKDQKNRDSSRKSHRERRASNEESQSASHGKNKDESRSRRDSKDSKSDRRHDKDKDREKRWDKEKSKERSKTSSSSSSNSSSKSKSKKDKRDKRDRRDSEKQGEYVCSKRQEQRDKRRSNDDTKRSKSNDKSEELRVERRERKKKSPTDGSMKSLVDDGDSGEENNDRRGINVDDEFDEIVLSVSDSDCDVQEECLKIFQEYQAPERSKATVESSKELTSILDKEQIEDTAKKRIAHPSAAACIGRQPIVNQLPKKSINPQQKMYERWRLMREAESVVSASSGVNQDTRRRRVEAACGDSEVKLNGNVGVRIAHVPYAKSLAMEKKRVTENANKSTEAKATDNCKTAAQTAKSGVRVAHVPQAIPQLIRPEPLQVATQKFPLNVRQYYVNTMHDVCVQIYTNAEDAAQRAVKEEYACHERCKALSVYKNSCMLATHRLRKEVDQNPSIEGNLATTSSNNIVSHQAILASKARGSWSVLKTKRSVTQFRGASLYNMMKKWILTEQQLRDNGFPRSHPDGQKGRAKIYVANTRNQSVLSKVPNERICSRCSQAYMIDKHGFAVRQQNCIYHWGRKVTIRGEGKYTCCQQYGSATGCCDAKTHVWEYVDYENLRGYVKTLPKDTTIEEQGVYALDCEMSYTTQGLELTRITVVDEDCNVVYETLVKPQNSVIDYNTRFSGITEESMKDVTTTLLDVQATLLTMFSDKTILVGHSLESDFKALRLLHDTVVDTSVMFPHKNGYPQKRALKNLCSEYLRKLIQNDVGGHDSKEDAVACMELILWKAKEEAKLQ